MKYGFLLLLFYSWLGTAQEVWSLEHSIKYAINQNLGLKLSELSIQNASVDLKQNIHQRYPNLNAGINGGISFGRSIDPTTNDFISDNIIYTNYNLTSGIPIYQAGLINNSIKKSRLDLKASKESYQQAIYDLSLSVASLYLSVLQAEEALKLAGENVSMVGVQLSQIRSLIRLGSKPESDALEIEVQVAKSAQSMVNAENTLDLAWLQFRQALRIPGNIEIKLEAISSELVDQTIRADYGFEQLYQHSLENTPGLKAAKLRLESAKIGERIARASYFPSIYGSANIGSRFSDAAQTINTESRRTIVPGVEIDGKPVQYSQIFRIPIGTELIPFKNQFDQFLGYGVGVSINVPIYQNYLPKATTQRAKIVTNQFELQLEQEQENIKQEITQAIVNAKAAIKEYQSAFRTKEAAEVSRNKTQKKFEIGSANSFELNTAQSNLQSAEINLLIAKYQLLFRQKILDFYAGNFLLTKN
ncbi:MAG: TolC family protein [Bacteroidota bacterium]|nr:TolC family protein [Bacteroidota bacterium]